MSDTWKDKKLGKWKKAFNRWRKGRWWEEVAPAWPFTTHPLGPVPSWYKKLLRQLYRAKANQAVARGEDPPPEKKNADYYW
jgi:hypothetical protein